MEGAAWEAGGGGGTGKNSTAAAARSTAADRRRGRDLQQSATAVTLGQTPRPRSADDTATVEPSFQSNLTVGLPAKSPTHITTARLWIHHKPEPRQNRLSQLVAHQRCCAQDSIRGKPRCTFLVQLSKKIAQSVHESQSTFSCATLKWAPMRCAKRARITRF